MVYIQLDLEIVAVTMNEPKDHHFSPVFYLKGWCNSALKVMEYSRPYREVKVQPKPPTATGFKSFLYSLEGVPEAEKQVIEKHYMSKMVDNPAAHALQILINRDKAGLTGSVRSDWTRFLIASLYRRPEAVNKVIEVFKSVMQKNLNANPDSYKNLKEDDPPTPFEWIQKNQPHFVSNAGKIALMDGIENEQIGNTIINMSWSVLDLQNSNYDLLTSDAPTIRTKGLGDTNCLIVMPLNPSLLFVAAHDKKVEASFLHQDATKIAVWMNNNVVRAAEKYVYGRSDRHLRFIENRLHWLDDKRQSII